MIFDALSPTWRTRLARFVLVLTVGTTIATSSNQTSWSVHDEQSLVVPPRQPEGGLVTQAVIRYRAPRGAWPLSLRPDPDANRDPYMIEMAGHFDDSEVRSTYDGFFEVRCRKECEGIIVVDLRIAWREPGDGGWGAGPLPVAAPPALKLVAGVYGSQSKGFGCDRQVSSIDRPDAPPSMEIELTVDPFDEALFGDGGVPVVAPFDGGAP